MKSWGLYREEIELLLQFEKIFKNRFLLIVLIVVVVVAIMFTFSVRPLRGQRRKIDLALDERIAIDKQGRPFLRRAEKQIESYE